MCSWICDQVQLPTMIFPQRIVFPSQEYNLGPSLNVIFAHVISLISRHYDHCLWYVRDYDILVILWVFSRGNNLFPYYLPAFTKTCGYLSLALHLSSACQHWTSHHLSKQESVSNPSLAPWSMEQAVALKPLQFEVTWYLEECSYWICLKLSYHYKNIPK